LLAPARAIYKKTLDEIVASGLRRERVAVISLATDGLWLMELLGVCPFSARQREEVIAELLRMAEG